MRRNEQHDVAVDGQSAATEGRQQRGGRVQIKRGDRTVRVEQARLKIEIRRGRGDRATPEYEIPRLVKVAAVYSTDGQTIVSNVDRAGRRHMAGKLKRAAGDGFDGAAIEEIA